MFALRRAATKAVFAQPARQLSSLKPLTRVSPFQSEKPALRRLLHQSRIRLADEQKSSAEAGQASPAEASTSGETVTKEPSEAELRETRSESIVSADVVESAKEAGERAQDKAQEAAEEAKTMASNVVEQTQGYASSAAETVQNAASSVARSARQMFPPNDSSTASGSEPAPSKIIYIGNLFFEVTSAQLEAEFGQFGEITNSRVVTDGQGLSKGFGYIEFATQDSADRAVQTLDQKVFQGRRMAVQYHLKRATRNHLKRPALNNSPSKTLFIGNMSYQMSDRDLNDLFREIRNVLDVRVAIDRRSGQPRGFAHADFVDIESAKSAKALLEAKVVYGRQLRVDFSATSPHTTTVT